MKFASFENIVAAIWNYLPGTKADYGKGAQTAVAFSGGYMAGILCAIVSHPADVMVSKLNADRAPGEAFGAAMSRIYGKIGFSGLWNGLPVRIVMIGTLTGKHTSDCGDFRGKLTSRRSTMDDLRFFQDLRWSSNYRQWRREAANCEGLNKCKSSNDACKRTADAHVYTSQEGRKVCDIVTEQASGCEFRSHAHKLFSFRPWTFDCTCNLRRQRNWQSAIELICQCLGLRW